MKKLSLLFIVVIGFATISFAQTAAADAGKIAVQASQTVNAADAQTNSTTTDAKCASATTGKTCCMSGRSEVKSTAAASESADQCKTTTFGMTAQKPEEAKVEETPKK